VALAFKEQDSGKVSKSGDAIFLLVTVALPSRKEELLQNSGAAGLSELSPQHISNNGLCLLPVSSRGMPRLSWNCFRGKVEYAPHTAICVDVTLLNCE
jgi:hypothetical protein